MGGELDNSRMEIGETSRLGETRVARGEISQMVKVGVFRMGEIRMARGEIFRTAKVQMGQGEMPQTQTKWDPNFASLVGSQDIWQETAMPMPWMWDNSNPKYSRRGEFGKLLRWGLGINTL